MMLAKLRRLDLASLASSGRNLGFGAFSRVTALGSQFVVLILLGKFMEKSVFGDFMIAFAMTRLLSTGLGTGFATLLVYHISRNATVDREIGLTRSITLLAFATGGTASLSLWLLGPQIAALFSKPTLTMWLTFMSPFLLFSTLLTVGVGALDGRGKITRSITMLELIPNIIRLICLPMLLLIGFPALGVAIIMTLSVLLPWAAIAAPLFRRSGSGLAPLTAWDLQYSGKLILHSFAAMQMQGIDMIVIGWLFTSNQAADYAIASRIAALLPFFQQILVKSYTTKVGQTLHLKDYVTLQAATFANVRSTVLLVGLTTAAALAVYPIFLCLMGNFGSSMPLMAALAVAPVIRSYFSANDPLLRMAGMANASLMIMLLGCSFVVLFPVALHNMLGTFTLPLAMLASAIILNPIGNHFIRRGIRVKTIPADLGWTMGLSFVAMLPCILFDGNLFFWYAGIVALLSSLAIIGRINRRKGELIDDAPSHVSGAR